MFNIKFLNYFSDVSEIGRSEKLGGKIKVLIFFLAQLTTIKNIIIENIMLTILK